MRIRATGACALYALLVLTLLLEAAGHDLLCAYEDQALPRVADQGASAEGRAPSPGPDIAPGSPQYEHECPCCLRGGQRLSLGPTPASRQPLLVARASRAPEVGQPTRRPSASHTSRGPPAS